MPLLAENFHVIAPDYPSLGYSDAPPPTAFLYTFDNMAKTILELTDTIGFDSYTLYLTDFGALIGWIIARTRPERVTAVVSQNGPAYNVGVISSEDEQWKALIELTLNPTTANKEAMAEVISFKYTKQLYVTGAADLTMVSPDTYHLDYSRFQRPGQFDIQIEFLISYCDYLLHRLPEAQAYLRQYQPRLLAIWGANDPFFPSGGAEAFKTDLPDAEVHLYDAGHFAIETHLIEIVNHMNAFLLPQPTAKPIAFTLASVVAAPDAVVTVVPLALIALLVVLGTLGGAVLAKKVLFGRRRGYSHVP